MLPDHLVGLIAEKPFRTQVPAAKVAFGSDQEKGVFLGVRRQQAEAFVEFLR